MTPIRGLLIPAEVDRVGSPIQPSAGSATVGVTLSLAGQSCQAAGNSPSAAPPTGAHATPACRAESSSS